MLSTVSLANNRFTINFTIYMYTSSTYIIVVDKVNQNGQHHHIKVLLNDLSTTIGVA